ncbi:MAG: hypothetical protein AAFR87_04960, partial [Bacteroidota bacterium]
AMMEDSFDIDVDRIFQKLSPDFKQVFPLLVNKLSWEDSPHLKTYKRYWEYGGDGELVEGELWQLFVDAPYSYAGSPAGTGYIPPYQTVKSFFINGGGPGGMGPGCAWTPFELKEEEYEQMVSFLLAQNTSLLKEKHFYIPKERFLIDRELNAKYPKYDEWWPEFRNKYG